MILPAITLYQPWATWIMRGWKLIETRTHSRFYTLLRQTIVIHAGKSVDGSEYVTKNPFLTKEQLLYKPEEVVGGCVLGTAFVDGFRQLNDIDSKDALIDCGRTKRWGLFLTDIKLFPTPIPCRGEMGIWYYDVELCQKVRKVTENKDQTKLF